MKFLATQTQTLTDEKAGLKLTINSISTAQQAAISDLSVNGSFEGRMRLIGYLLRNVVAELEIDGQTLDPLMVADKADISDKATSTKMLEIGALIVSHFFPKAQDVKN